MSILYPHKIDISQNAYQMVAVNREDFTDTTFLYSGQFPKVGASLISQSFQETVQSFASDTNVASYIFHTAFCCSTLLAKALDNPGKTLALKEPEVIVDLAHIRRQSSGDMDNWGRLAELTFKLMDTSFAKGEKNIIKPTNLANNILEALLLSPIKRPVFIIYSDLKSFLISLLKKKEEGRVFGRKLFNILSLDFPELRTEIGERMLFTMTDLQIGALAWHMQMNYLLKMMALPRGQNIKTLHCDDFLNNISHNLLNVSQYLECPLSPEEVSQRINSDIFKKNSKFGNQDFQENARAQENKAIQSDYDDILDKIIEWSQFASISPEILTRMPNDICQS